MKRAAFHLLLVMTTLLLSALVRTADPPAAREVSTDRSAASVQPLELLPSRTLAAVELRDLSTRWPEVTRHQPLVTMIERIAGEFGVTGEEIAKIAGEHAVIAFVLSDDARSVVPVALVEPSAEALIAAVRNRDTRWGASLVTERARGTLWLTRIGSSAALKRWARGDGTSLVESLPLEEVLEYLPRGGLVRGWLNPEAVRDLLNELRSEAQPMATQLFLALAWAEINPVRFAALSRDLSPDGVVTDAVVGIDTQALAPEMALALSSPPGRPVLPAELPAGVALAASFRPQLEAVVAWLRQAGENDPRGPLRNFGFWLDEMQARTGRDLASDLFDPLDGQASVLLLTGGEAESPALVGLFETSDPDRVRQTLLDILAWRREQGWGWTLGLTLPSTFEIEVDDRVGFAVRWSSLVGAFEGPMCITTDRHLIVGTSRKALLLGLHLSEETVRWSLPNMAETNSAIPHETKIFAGKQLAQLLDSLLGSSGNADRGSVRSALLELIGSIKRGTVAVWYEGNVVRVRSEVRFVAVPTS
ncbi:MAG: hypothetical protein JSV80_03615 [Acidobacteriota bacterium]|nr:MAG: hypothetical protein JSV80_03615 [Acidobacteriota bacterium]